MGSHSFSENDKGIIRLLKQKEMTRKELAEYGYHFGYEFLLKCERNGILLYESDDMKPENIKYGVYKIKRRKWTSGKK